MATTWDPATNTNSGTLSNGNLTYAASSASGNVVRSTFFTSGWKFYFEYTMTTATAGNHGIGVVQSTQATATPTSAATVPSGMWEWRSDGLKVNNGTSSALGTAASNGDVIMVACDPAAGKLWFGKGGTWFGSGDPVAGTNPAYTGLTGSIGAFVNMFTNTGSGLGTVNFGATAFSFTAPTGYGKLVDGTTTAVGAASGSATDSGVLSALANMVGSSTGSATVSGAITGLFRAVAAATGLTTVAGTGVTAAVGVGAAVGSAVASMVSDLRNIVNTITIQRPVDYFLAGDKDNFRKGHAPWASLKNIFRE